MKIRTLLALALPALCFGCSADYLNRYAQWYQKIAGSQGGAAKETENLNSELLLQAGLSKDLSKTQDNSSEICA